MAKFKQGHRELSIDTPLGSDVLLLTKFTGTEALSAPFEYELEMLSEKPDINFSDILGKNVSVSLSAKAGALSAASSIRYFNGYISHFQQTHSEGNIYHYSAVMVPWLWFLTRRRDCRIFQNLTVPQIVQQIFSDLGFSSVVDNALTATYRTWDYCVQYRETDFDFVSRLLEHEGIYYFFKHEKDTSSGNITHKLVLADGVSASVNINGDASISYLGPDRAAKGDYIRDWKVRQALQSGNFMLNDYDFTAPKKSLLTSAANTAGVVSQTDHRVYDYPGGYSQSADGSNYVQARMQEQQAGFAVASGNSNNRGIEAGYLFTLTDHPVSTMNQTYLIQSVQYDIRNENYLQNQPGSVETTFTSNLTCFESTQQFRPARSTPKAVVRGPQTAVVVGPSGEKIYTDEYGRVKVQFYWDTYGTSDQNSSCWIRVSQSWAGAPNNGLNWGDMALPHVGDEVIVDFLEGDPDKPLITGRVYNADNMPPFDLPGNKHKRIMQDDYGNQIILDASPGDEHVRIHSPHHRSTLLLGKSSQLLTYSNAINCAWGDSASIMLGLNASATVGENCAISVGGYINAKIAESVQATIGPQINANWGPTYTWDKTASVKASAADTSILSEDHVIIGADKTVCIVGGNDHLQYTAGAKFHHEGVWLSAGPPMSVTPPGMLKGWRFVLGVSAALPIAAAAVIIGVQASDDPNVNSDSSWSATAPDSRGDAALAAGAGAAAIGLVLGWILMAVMAKKAKTIKPESHTTTTAKAYLDLKSSGNIALAGSKGVKIGAGTPGSGMDLNIKPTEFSVASTSGSTKIKVAKFDVNSGAFTVAK